MATKIENKETKIAAMQWRRRGGEVLVTNDFGCYARMKDSEFNNWLAGRLSRKSPLYENLSCGSFVRDRLDFEGLISKWRKKNSFLFSGPGLHIFVITLGCNHKCLYCQSGAVGEKSRKTDMSWSVAKRSVDTAFQSPRSSITIEFQGGEPLCNWNVLKKTIEYSRKKEKETGKMLKLSLVSNFSLMDEDKASFLLKNMVSICTSLDGPAFVHNKNRVFFGGDSHALTIKWIRYFSGRHDNQDGKVPIYKPSALLTVSRHSLSFHREIVDEYVRMGLEGIFIRPISPIGYARKLWGEVGYSAEEFLVFYGKSLRYILELNRKGVKLSEKTAQMLFRKIFDFEDPGFLDLRYPCGASIGQLAYNYDGGIYTCDEGRMVGWEGDDFFKVGQVGKTSYKSMMNKAQTRGCAISSNLEIQPRCFRCAYKPYCGVCPVVNYETQGSLWGNMPTSDRCKIFMGIFDLLFDLVKIPKNEKIFREWANAEKKD